MSAAIGLRDGWCWSHCISLTGVSVARRWLTKYKRLFCFKQTTMLYAISNRIVVRYVVKVRDSDGPEDSRSG